MNLCLAAYAAFAIGVCDPTTDYCPAPVGNIELEADWICIGKRIKIQSEISHYSRWHDGEPGGGDRGTEFFFPLKVEITLY